MDASLTSQILYSRPPSAVSFSSTVSGASSTRVGKSKIPVRIKTYKADVKYEEKLNTDTDLNKKR